MSKRKSIEEILNDITVSLIFDQLSTLALDRFVWNGLESTTIKPIYIETALFNHGQALFCKNKKQVAGIEIGGLICLPCSFSSDFNMYNEPLAYQAFGKGYTERYAIEECVNIRNNPRRSNMVEPLMMFAKRIADVQRTADVNVNVCKTPFLLHTTQNTELSIKNIFKKIDENAVAIFADKKFDMSDIEVLELTRSLREMFIGAELMDYQQTLFNQALSFIGINNVSIDKKERLITDEANANNEFIFDNIDLRLQWRKNACEEINKMFSLNLTVEIKQPPKPEPEETEETEDDNDGELHG